MKKLFELVLKTVDNSKTSEIFWCKSKKGSENFYLTSNPLIISGKNYLTNFIYSEVKTTFDFKFKFSDGDPNVEVQVKNFEVTETKTEEIKKGWFWSKKITGGTVSILKSYPVYSINAGELSYVTTVEESKKLHEAYTNLFKRDKDSKLKKQELQIINRLEGKVELNTNKRLNQRGRMPLGS